jgi:hypothetical protein
LPTTASAVFFFLLPMSTTSQAVPPAFCPFAVAFSQRSFSRR